MNICHVVARVAVLSAAAIVLHAEVVFNSFFPSPDGVVRPGIYCINPPYNCYVAYAGYAGVGEVGITQSFQIFTKTQLQRLVLAVSGYTGNPSWTPAESVIVELSRDVGNAGTVIEMVQVNNVPEDDVLNGTPPLSVVSQLQPTLTPGTYWVRVLPVGSGRPIKWGNGRQANGDSALALLVEGSVTRNDFNLDARPDLIFQEQISGLAQVWFLGGQQGSSIVDAANLTRQNTWRIAAVADLNQDDHPDLIWQDPLSGAVQVWFLGGPSGTNISNAMTLTSASAWRVVSAADFNRDAIPDIVWQDPITGASQVWFLGGPTGTTVMSSATLSGSNTWRIAGAADFNNDGSVDVMWQDPTSGWAQIWFLQGTQGTMISGAANLVQANTWRIAAVSDLDSDGHPDLIWQDPVSGASQAWFLAGAQGNQITDVLAISGPNTWKIVGPR